MAYLQQLRYFSAVARLRSFVAAARSLYVSQPALSMQIKQLEKNLGVTLLDRRAGGVSLTEAGATFIDYAHTVLETIERGERAIAHYKTPGSIQIELGISSASHLIFTSEILEECGHGDPQLFFHLQEKLSDDLWRCVLIGELEAALCYDPPHMTGITMEPVLVEDYFLVGPPDVLGESNGDIPFEELAEFQLILDQGGTSSLRKIDAVSRIRGIEMNISAYSTEKDLSRLLIKSGNKCTIAPYRKFFHLINDQKVLARRIIDPAFNRTLALIFNKSFQSFAADLLSSRLHSVIQQHLSDGLLGRHARLA